MSVNLKLRGTSTCHMNLRQTPSDVTKAALAPGADTKAIYFAYLDSCVAATTDGKRDFAQDTRRHKRDVIAYIDAHPRAKWSAI